MATLTKGKTFTNGELVTPQKLHELVDLGTVSGIVNADISASAAIADTKLAQITTANKVANSATSATSANTANAIVTRDGSGNFSAGTITATLSGNATNVTGTVAVANGGTGATTAATARTNLGLGNSATLNTGTTSGTVATGDHTHSAASTTVAGFLSTTDKTKLDAATNLNTASTIVQRDASGNFSAGTITASLFGNATTATSCTGNAATASSCTGNAANVTGTVAVANGGTGATTAANARTNLGLGNSATLNTGTASGTVAAGDHTHSAASTTVAGFLSTTDKTKLDAATNLNTASTIVQRDVSGNFSAGTITAALSGNATTATTAASCSGNAATATTLETARTINGVSFDGSTDIIVTANPSVPQGAAKAWVNADMTTLNNTAGYLGQPWTGTKVAGNPTVTINTSTAHGLKTGNYVAVTFGSAAVTCKSTITVTSSTQFEIQATGTSGTLSATSPTALYSASISSQYNVNSVFKETAPTAGTGTAYVNFDTALGTSNYASFATAEDETIPTPAPHMAVCSRDEKTVNYQKVVTFTNSSQPPVLTDIKLSYIAFSN